MAKTTGNSILLPVQICLLLIFLCILAARSQVIEKVEANVVLRHRPQEDKSTSEDDEKDKTKRSIDADLIGIFSNANSHERSLMNPIKNDQRRRRRYVTASDRIDIQTTMNDLRRTVGASNMPYMEYDSTGENDASSWTSSCNYDRYIVVTYDSFSLKYITQQSFSSIPNFLRTQFNIFFGRQMSSVYLSSVGCYTTYCGLATAEGKSYIGATLVLCLFRNESQWDINGRQYKLGEACTECESGSFWCDNGLCRVLGGCSESNSDCYCHPNCLNCAEVNQASCTCRCLSGWSGSRCETKVSVNASQPTCTTTQRVPRGLTTINLNGDGFSFQTSMSTTTVSLNGAGSPFQMSIRHLFLLAAAAPAIYRLRSLL